MGTEDTEEKGALKHSSVTAHRNTEMVTAAQGPKALGRWSPSNEKGSEHKTLSLNSKLTQVLK